MQSLRLISSIKYWHVLQTRIRNCKKEKEKEKEETWLAYKVK